jgi:hypothetical protein
MKRDLTTQSSSDAAAKLSSARRLLNAIFPALTDSFQKLMSDSDLSYHRERHYMRGPGPKWHAKHARNHDQSGSRASI